MRVRVRVSVRAQSFTHSPAKPCWPCHRCTLLCVRTCVVCVRTPPCSWCGVVCGVWCVVCAVCGVCSVCPYFPMQLVCMRTCGCGVCGAVYSVCVRSPPCSWCVVCGVCGVCAQLVAVRKKFGQSLEVLREYQTRIVDLESAASASKEALQQATDRHASVVDAHALELRALNESVGCCICVAPCGLSWRPCIVPCRCVRAWATRVDVPPPVV